MIRNIRLLFIHNFLTQFRFQTAYLVIYFSQILGSYTAGMSILAVENLTAAFLDVPTGYVSDRIGRKLTLAIGSLCSAAGVASYALADNVVWLLVGAFLSGLSACLFNGNNNALLFETLKEEGIEDQFHHFQGRTSSMFQLALGISALLSSLMAGHGLRLIFILGIFPQVLAFFVSLLFRDPTVHMATAKSGLVHLRVALRQTLANPRLRLLLIGQAISYGAGEAAFNFRNAFINALWPVWAVGIYRALNNAGGFFGYWFSGRIIDRFTAPLVLVAAEIYWFVSQAAAVVMSNVVSPVIFLTGALMYGPFMVSCDKLLQDEFSDDQRATMGSISTFVGSLFYAVMAVAIGSISDRFGLAFGVGFGLIISSLSLPVYFRLFRKHFRIDTDGRHPS
jgi:MFS family permease